MIARSARTSSRSLDNPGLLRKSARLAVTGTGLFTAAYFLVASGLLRRWLRDEAECPGPLEGRISESCKPQGERASRPFRDRAPQQHQCRTRAGRPCPLEDPSNGNQRCGPLEPVTFFRPIKSCEPGLARHLEVFLAGVEPGDRILLGASGEAERELPIKYDLMVSLMEQARAERSGAAAREAGEICSAIVRRDISYRDIRMKRKDIDALVKEFPS